MHFQVLVGKASQAISEPANVNLSDPNVAAQMRMLQAAVAIGEAGGGSGTAGGSTMGGGGGSGNGAEFQGGGGTAIGGGSTAAGGGADYTSMLTMDPAALSAMMAAALGSTQCEPSALMAALQQQQQSQQQG